MYHSRGTDSVFQFCYCIKTKRREPNIVDIYFQRHLRIPNMGNMRRDELLDIFHHYCVPYGQRKYRDTGRGKLLNKTRQSGPEPAKKLNIMNNQEIKHSKGNPNCDTLRPPLEDFLSSNVKRIKIETTISPITNTDFFNMNKRKIAIDSVSIS